MAILEGKKVIIIGDRDGVPGPAIAECVKTAGGEIVFSTRYYPETDEQTVKVEAVECDGKIYVLKNYVME